MTSASCPVISSTQPRDISSDSGKITVHVLCFISVLVAQNARFSFITRALPEIKLGRDGSFSLKCIFFSEKEIVTLI